MRVTCKSARSVLIAVLGAVPNAPAVGINEPELGAFQRPEETADENFVAQRANEALGDVAEIAAFEKWKTFEDDRVKFTYPDHEAITVEVKTGEPVPVGGDRVSSVDTSFSRAYRLTAKGGTLTVLMLKEGADWFDDGICLCGEIVYERYLVRDRHCYRFGFLGDGVIKKMEVLGDRERLMMFEWTHSPIHPAVYHTIARSIELKRKGTWEEDKCRERVMKEYGPVGAVGWFDEGTTAGTVIARLGAPAKVREDGSRVWEYPKEEDGYRSTETISLPFADNKLVRFDSDYHDSGWDTREAIPGSVPWMKSKSAIYEKPRVRGEEGLKMPEELKAELLRLFLEKADDPDVDFNRLCEVLKILIWQGVQDPTVLDIVRRRFSAEGGHYAAWVLHEAGHPEDVALFIEKIRAAYRAAVAKPDEDPGGFSDLHNWLSFVPDEDERYPDLLREGLSSRSGSVRNTA